MLPVRGRPEHTPEALSRVHWWALCRALWERAARDPHHFVLKSLLLFLLPSPPGVLHFHLKETPTDFFVDIVSRDNFLTTTLQVHICPAFSGVQSSPKTTADCLSSYILQTFFEIALDNGAIDPALRERTAKFKAYVS